MKSTILRTLAAITIFFVHYTLWASLIRVGESAMQALAVPISSPASLWLVPAEGAVFGCACVAVFWQCFAWWHRILLIVLASVVNCIAFAGEMSAFFGGIYALDLAAVVAALLCFIPLRLVTSKVDVRSWELLAVVFLASLSIVLPAFAKSPIGGLFLGKAAWWLAVLGVAALAPWVRAANNSIQRTRCARR